MEAGDLREKSEFKDNGENLTTEVALSISALHRTHSTTAIVLTSWQTSLIIVLISSGIPGRGKPAMFIYLNSAHWHKDNLNTYAKHNIRACDAFLHPIRGE